MAEHSWAEARKTAAQIGNFLQKLDRAVEVFDTVSEAELRLVKVHEELVALAERQETAEAAAVVAEENAAADVARVAAERVQLETDLAVYRAAVDKDRAALTADVERARDEVRGVHEAFQIDWDFKYNAHQIALGELRADEEAAEVRITKLRDVQETLVARTKQIVEG